MVNSFTVNLKDVEIIVLSVILTKKESIACRDSSFHFAAFRKTDVIKIFFLITFKNYTISERSFVI